MDTAKESYVITGRSRGANLAMDPKAQEGGPSCHLAPKSSQKLFVKLLMLLWVKKYIYLLGNKILIILWAIPTI